MDVKPTMQKHNWWSLEFTSAIGMEDEMEEISWDVINLLACCMFISFTTCASESIWIQKQH